MGNEPSRSSRHGSETSSPPPLSFEAAKKIGEKIQTNLMSQTSPSKHGKGRRDDEFNSSLLFDNMCSGIPAMFMGNNRSGNYSDHSDDYTDDDATYDSYDKRRSRKKDKKKGKGKIDESDSQSLVSEAYTEGTDYTEEEYNRHKRRDAKPKKSNKYEDNSTMDEDDTFNVEENYLSNKASKSTKDNDGNASVASSGIISGSDTGALSKPLASSFAKRCYFTKAGIGKITQHYEGLTLNGNIVLMLAAAMKLKGCPTICDEDLRRVEQTYPNQFSRLPDELLLSSGWRRISKYCHFSMKPIPDGVSFFHSKNRVHVQTGGYYFLLAAAVGMVRPSDVEPITLDNLVVLQTDYPSQCDAVPQELVNGPENWILVDKFCFFSGGPINTEEDVYYKADFDGNSIYMLAFLSPSLTPGELYRLGPEPDILNDDNTLKTVAGVEGIESVYDLTERDFDDLKLYHLGPCRALPPFLLQPTAWTKVLPPRFVAAKEKALARARDYEARNPLIQSTNAQMMNQQGNTNSGYVELSKTTNTNNPRPMQSPQINGHQPYDYAMQQHGGTWQQHQSPNYNNHHMSGPIQNISPMRQTVPPQPYQQTAAGVPPYQQAQMYAPNETAYNPNRNGPHVELPQSQPQIQPLQNQTVIQNPSSDNVSRNSMNQIEPNQSQKQVFSYYASNIPSTNAKLQDSKNEKNDIIDKPMDENDNDNEVGKTTLTARPDPGSFSPTNLKKDRPDPLQEVTYSPPLPSPHSNRMDPPENENEPPSLSASVSPKASNVPAKSETNIVNETTNKGSEVPVPVPPKKLTLDLKKNEVYVHERMNEVLSPISQVSAAEYNINEAPEPSENEKEALTLDITSKNSTPSQSPTKSLQNSNKFVSPLSVKSISPMAKSTTSGFSSRKPLPVPESPKTTASTSTGRVSYHRSLNSMISAAGTSKPNSNRRLKKSSSSDISTSPKKSFIPKYSSPESKKSVSDEKVSPKKSFIPKYRSPGSKKGLSDDQMSYEEFTEHPKRGRSGDLGGTNSQEKKQYPTSISSASTDEYGSFSRQSTSYEDNETLSKNQSEDSPRRQLQFEESESFENGTSNSPKVDYDVGSTKASTSIDDDSVDIAPSVAESHDSNWDRKTYSSARSVGDYSQSSAMRGAQELLRKNRQQRLAMAASRRQASEAAKKELPTPTNKEIKQSSAHVTSDDESSLVSGSSVWTDNSVDRGSRRALILQMAKARMTKGKMRSDNVDSPKSIDTRSQLEKNAGVDFGPADLD